MADLTNQRHGSTNTKQSKISNEVYSALSEYFEFCPYCFRNMDGGNCFGCRTYYGDCDCKPLSPEQIREGLVD